MNEIYTKFGHKKRNNAEWIADLSGAKGPIQQEEAIENLSRYLFIVVYNNLRKQHSNLMRLHYLGNEELCDLAMDFTQQFMEKMVQNQFALLGKYHAEGRFTTWAATVTLNLVRSEFRKARWSRVEPLSDRSVSTILNRDLGQPESMLISSQFYEVVQASLNKLPERTRIVFIRSIIDGESTSSLATEMGVTPNTIYLLIHRGRKKIQKFLFDAGFEYQEALVFKR